VAQGSDERGQAALAPAGIFASLRLRDFRLLWAGQVSHTGALWAEQIARPVLVYELTESAAHLGGVVAMRTLPQLALGIVAGVIADRFDRRRVLIATKIGAFAVGVVFAALLIAGQLELWHIYATSFVRGALMAFDQPARNSLIPSVVPPAWLMNAVALMATTQSSMRVVGAAVAGIMLALVGTEGTFLLVPIVYVGSVAATIAMRTPQQRRPPRGRGVSALGADLVEGLRFAAGHRPIRMTLLLSLIFFTFGVPYLQVFAPLFALEVLEIGNLGVGILLAVSGLGALVGALTMASRSPTRVGLLLPVLLAALGGALVVFAASASLPGMWGRPWIVVPLLAIAVVGMLQTAYFAFVQTMLLDAAPEELRARVISLISLDRATATAGAAAGGLLADAAGTQVAQASYGVLLIIGGVAALLLAREFLAYRVSSGGTGASSGRGGERAPLGAGEADAAAAAASAAGPGGRAAP
jgi:MFS transporter, DHA1 family, staphyloferrin A biosynthesis exporter